MARRMGKRRQGQVDGLNGRSPRSWPDADYHRGYQEGLELRREMDAAHAQPEPATPADGRGE